jgi:hypothetical protein
VNRSVDKIIGHYCRRHLVFLLFLVPDVYAELLDA